MPTPERYVSIKDANTPTVRFELDLPSYVDKYQVGVNLGKINALMGIGGIRHLRVVGVSEMSEESPTTPTIVGIDGRGQALAGRLKEGVKAPLYRLRSDTNGIEHDDVPEYRSVNAIIVLNMQEAHRRISDDFRVRDGTRSPKAWSAYLNEAVKSGITSEGVCKFSGYYQIFGENLCSN